MTIYFDSPVTEGIILEHNEDGFATNIFHNVQHHSTSGMAWGYAGSGPADLALNILESVLQNEGFDGPICNVYKGTCFMVAFRLHQDFKETFLVSVPMYNTTIIPYEDILTWLREHEVAV